MERPQIDNLPNSNQINETYEPQSGVEVENASIPSSSLDIESTNCLLRERSQDATSIMGQNRSPFLQHDMIEPKVVGVSLPPHNSSSSSIHPMQTRSKTGNHTGHVKTNFTKHAQTMITNDPPSRVSGLDIQEPKSVKRALQIPHWVAAMRDELDALRKNNTWELVPRPSDANIDIITNLSKEFALKDLGPLHYFLGREESTTPRDADLIDATMYRSIVGALPYLTITRIDICHVVNRSTLSLIGFCDADWVGCSITRRSTTGFCIFLGANCISWSSKKQSTVARSTAEAEYRALASTAAELLEVAPSSHSSLRGSMKACTTYQDHDPANKESSMTNNQEGKQKKSSIQCRNSQSKLKIFNHSNGLNHSKNSQSRLIAIT
ncbi:hypothetical protein SLEP1_g55188 [Rubroshorea leprosula]|uniref:Mitochondrial protein n=1 Tax=Rubroshorea leprosula TaxID=152421 RepID=A0AAV5MFH1_9ROSI|nr:hypothetical protein SLEP1_g55188 [Rubroshorea leprosula]